MFCAHKRIEWMCFRRYDSAIKDKGMPRKSGSERNNCARLHCARNRSVRSRAGCAPSRHYGRKTDEFALMTLCEPLPSTEYLLP